MGAGPAGLLLGQVLAARGISTAILERQSRDYVEARVRAGVLEEGTVELMRRIGVADRLDRDGLVHEGFEIAIEGVRRRVDLSGLTGGKIVTVYGQTELTKDLITARLAAEEPLIFEAEEVTPHGLDGQKPSLSYQLGGAQHTVQCDFIAGCDGFHGVCRNAIPHSQLVFFERDYPFAWLGVLAEAPPPSHELIYSRNTRGFSLCSMRSPTLSRHYLQCTVNEALDAWSDDRFWDELEQRFVGEDRSSINRGRVVEKSVTAMRSFVVEPMQHGRMFLAGDAAHIVPPTGAKGLNLAASDAHYLSQGLDEVNDCFILILNAH